jgi:hypothetical protein
MKFVSCLEALEKTAGLGETLKRVALTEVPGTKPWFIGAKKPVSDGLKAAKPGVSGTRPAATRRLASGAYDVSDLAKKMGLDK